MGNIVPRIHYKYSILQYLELFNIQMGANKKSTNKKNCGCCERQGCGDRTTCGKYDHHPCGTLEQDKSFKEKFNEYSAWFNNKEKVCEMALEKYEVDLRRHINNNASRQVIQCFEKLSHNGVDGPSLHNDVIQELIVDIRQFLSAPATLVTPIRQTGQSRQRSVPSFQQAGSSRQQEPVTPAGSANRSFTITEEDLDELVARFKRQYLS